MIWTADLQGAVQARTGRPAGELIGFAIRMGRLIQVLPDRILSFSLRTGTFEWEAPVKKAIAGLIQSEGDRIYSYFSGVFSCVDGVSGQVIYETRHPSNALESLEHPNPIPVDPETLAYGTRMGLRVFDLETGLLLTSRGP